MTNQEALEQLEYAKGIINRQGKDYLDERDFPVLECAINALEKQIPKKFKMVDDCTPICPVCGEEVWDMEWCNSCGQLLSDEAED
jgi:hypothetical protein